MNQPLALIIEDDPDLSIIFSEAVQAAGYQVEAIYSGDVAVLRLKEIVPDIILLDLHLPGVDGREIYRQIRANPELDQARVFIASADANLALSLQADMVLLKPVSFSQLRDLTKRFINRPRVLEQ